MTWWLWVLAGLVLGFAELLVPGFVFLGFGIAAVAVGALIAAGVLGEALPFDLAVFALLSVAAWLGLRRAVGVRAGQVKRIDRDINEP